MADNIKIEVRGFDKVGAKFLAMSAEFQAKALVSSALLANKVMEDTMEKVIEDEGLVDTGLLMSSIKRKRIVYPKDGIILVLTGVSKKVKGVDKKGKPRVPWRYANVLNPRYNITKQAFDQAKDDVANGFVKKIKNKLRKYEKAQAADEALARMAGGEMS